MGMFHPRHIDPTGPGSTPEPPEPRYYFYGDDGCIICQENSDYVESASYRAHVNCDCPVLEETVEVEKDSDSDESRGEAEEVLKNKTQSPSTTTEEKDGESVYNGSQHKATVTVSVNETFQGTQATDTFITEAFDLDGLEYETTVQEDFTVELENGEGVRAKASCFFETLSLSVDLYYKYPDGTEVFAMTMTDEATHILSASAELQDY